MKTSDINVERVGSTRMDYEEISDARRLRMPSSGPYVVEVDHNESRMHGDAGPTRAAGTGRAGAAGALSVRDADAGGLSPSATVHDVDPPLYSKVIRRCST